MRKTILLYFSLFSLFSFGQIQIGEESISLENIMGEAAFDLSGRSLSLSSDGRVLAVGAHLNDGNGDRSGHVRIYEKIDDNWIQIGSDINGEAPDDQSGISVSLSGNGNIVAIGAVGNNGDGLSDTFNCDSYTDLDYGHVRVYENINNTWIQIGSDINGESPGDRSGISVSLSSDGKIIAIGATSNNDNGEGSGQVRIYENINSTWQQVGSDLNGNAPGDMFGYSVSLSSDGNIVAIGASGNDSNGIDSGHVSIHKNDNDTWSQIGSAIDGKASGDRSGHSVSLSSDGSIVAIGAAFSDSNGEDSGHVHIYRNSNNIWTQLGSDIYGESAGFRLGTSISLSNDGSRIAIGADSNITSNPDSSHMSVYENKSETWDLIAKDIDGEESGGSLSLSGDGLIVAIAADSNDDNGIDSGRVRTYFLNNNLLPKISIVECSYSVLYSEGFESGWGIWNDGGSDSYRGTNSTYANTGTYSMRLRDNTSTSVGTTNNLDLTDYEEITIDFSYYCRSMDNSNEDFWLQISTNGGANFTTIEEWNKGDEFVNNQRYDDQVLIPGPFTSNTQFRFRADASSNEDLVYIDDIVISNSCNNNSSFNELSSRNIENTELFSSEDLVIPDEITSVLYPNPFINKINIKIEENYEKAEVEVFNILGQSVYSKTYYNKQAIHIPALNFRNGLYLIKMKIDGKMIIKKAIKE